MNGAPASFASRRAISVFPTPVGPMRMMLFGEISSRIVSGARWPAPAVPDRDGDGLLRVAPARYIVGQADAKKAVAIALRNRWRRQQAPEAIRDEISPNNIILIGPTGVGKTEIARRLAKLAGAPFIKVEASKFTEVGYVGRDVEGMIRDLVDSAIEMVRRSARARSRTSRNERVDERLLDLLLPPPPDGKPTRRRDAGAEPALASAGDEARGVFVVSASGDVEAGARPTPRRTATSARARS